MKIQKLLRLLDLRKLFNQKSTKFPRLRRGSGNSPLATDHLYKPDESPKHIDEIIIIPTSPNALENFELLVREKNIPKLTEYFGQFGIDSTTIQNNMDVLIKQELIDLSRVKTKTFGLG